MTTLVARRAKLRKQSIETSTGNNNFYTKDETINQMFAKGFKFGTTTCDIFTRTTKKCAYAEQYFKKLDDNIFCKKEEGTENSVVDQCLVEEKEEIIDAMLDAIATGDLNDPLNCPELQDDGSLTFGATYYVCRCATQTVICNKIIRISGGIIFKNAGDPDYIDNNNCDEICSS